MAIKRFFDIIVSSVLLLTVFPWLCLAIWIGNRITRSHGPLFFSQQRTGLNGSSFRMYKFRTMKVNENADTLQATRGDNRVTPLGHFLRHTSIDEIPQIVNVLRGEMSLIGPRPHMLYHTEYYTPLIPHYSDRHAMKPGLTGWAQINGSRGETKTIEDMQQRVDYDLWYIAHWSLGLDMQIVWRTVLLVFKNEKNAV